MTAALAGSGTGPGAGGTRRSGSESTRDAAVTPAFSDALSGLDGTADPVNPMALQTVFADPTAENHGVSSAADAPEFRVARIPIPNLPMTIDPAMLAKAEADLARQVERDRAEYEYTQKARRDAGVRSAAARQTPAATSQDFSNWLPPGVPDSVRRALAKATNATMSGAPAANQGVVRQRGTRTSAAGSQGPAGQRVNTTTGSRSRNSGKSGGAIGVILFIVVILFATGLGQKLIELIQDLVNR